MASVALIPLARAALAASVVSRSRPIFSRSSLATTELRLSLGLPRFVHPCLSYPLFLSFFLTLCLFFSISLRHSTRTGEPIIRGCYSGPIPNHPERETGEARVQEGRMCVARATGWVARCDPMRCDAMWLRRVVIPRVTSARYINYTGNI